MPYLSSFCLFLVSLFALTLTLKEPTLGGILSEQTPLFVDGGDTITSAAIAMSKGRKAVSSDLDC